MTLAVGTVIEESPDFARDALRASDVLPKQPPKFSAFAHSATCNPLPLSKPGQQPCSQQAESLNLTVI